MAGWTQSSRFIGISTPLGEDQLLLQGVSGREEVGRLFEYDLDLLSEKNNIDFNAIVGQNITLRIDLPAGGQRFINGFVRRFVQAGASHLDSSLTQYRATVVPWLWFLTRTADCRIFQNQKIPDIIKTVFSDRGFTDIEDRLSGTYREWTYCVQYRETDFNFVSRLMEQEGIYYFFLHENGKHTLVLCDALSKHKPQDPYGQVRYRGLSAATLEEETITEWTLDQQVQPGRYAHTDYNFTTSATELKSEHELKPDHARGEYEIYDFPGEHEKPDEAKDYAVLRMEELHVGGERFHGSSDARGLAVGHNFKLKGHPRSEWDQEYTLVSTALSASTAGYDQGGGDGFSCTLSAIRSEVQFRAPRMTPKPVVQGLQTAVVVGPKGEEIHTDEHGRIKVQFHWDRYGKRDENSSCWIRVAQASAGRRWGSMFIPRIGQEVVVEFEEGDPDRPLVTGSVYNDIQKPHYDLPAEKTKSYIKTNSSKGGEGFNEIRFEDKKGSEQIFIHAEKNYDLRVKNDRKERVFGNQHMIVGWEKDGKKGGDLREMVYEDHHLTIHKNQVQHVGGDMQLLVGDIDDGKGNQDIILKGGRTEKMEKDCEQDIGGDHKVKIAGTESFDVGKDRHSKVGSNEAVEAGKEIHLKAGMKVILEAGMQLTIKGPGGFVDIGPAGVTIQGTMVKINSGGAAGSGSGAKPQKPKKPEEAKPAKPQIADNSKSGAKSSS